MDRLGPATLAVLLTIVAAPSPAQPPVASKLPVALTPTYPDGFEGTIGSVRFLRDAQGAVRELSVGIDRVFDLRFDRRP